MSGSILNEIEFKRRKAKLEPIHVLIADRDARVAKLVRHILLKLGFKIIMVARDGENALKLMQENRVDMLVTDWHMEPMDGIELINYIRTDPAFINNALPIIMLTGKAEKYDVEFARDQGITEFDIKPFSAKTLSNRIAQVIDNPRAFIAAERYTGPDRRRKRPQTLPEDQRDYDAETNAKRVGDRREFTTRHGHEVSIFDPDYALKRKIGKELSIWDILTEENVRQAQQVITNAHGDFMEWVVVDLARLEHAYETLIETPEDDDAFSELLENALSIKAQAGTFGFDLASDVAKSLYNFARNFNLKQRDKSHLLVIRKHIDILYIIFHQNLTGQAAGLGTDIMGSLTQLVQKYSK